MTPLSRTADQLLRVATRLDGGFAEADVAPTMTAVLVNGQARAIPVTLVRLTDDALPTPASLPGQYGFRFDASSLALGDVVQILFRTRAGGRALDASVSGRVCVASGLGVPVAAPSGPPGGGGDGPPLDSASRVVFVGNSFTQNFGGMPNLLEYYVGERLGGSSVVLGPPPHLGTSIANGTDGYFPNMSLGGMALYPTIDQRQSGGSTDAIDAIASQPPGTYDMVALTSGFRQDDVGVDGIEYEVLAGAGGTNPNVYGVILEIKRRVVAEINARVPGISGTVIRMTQEGFNANNYADLSDIERIVRLQVLGARQLELEGIVARIVPEHYVWSRVQFGAFGAVGTAPFDSVPAYAGLTHSTSQQAGGRNYAWLNRTRGDVVPHTPNSHQNAIATIVAAWAWGYHMWGIDPRGDTTFSGDPSGLPSPIDDMLNATGTRIYGGQNVYVSPTNDGRFPYDVAANPSGPPDAELDLDWSLATQQQIQDRIVAALDDYTAGTTEFD